MEDNVYKQENNYQGKWGISWLYRWMTDKSQISVLMNKEPDIMNIYKKYQEIMELNKKQY